MNLNRRAISHLSSTFLALACLACAASASLQEAMAPEEFERAGLHKLTPEELAFLSAWVEGTVTDEKQKAVADIVPQGEDRFGADEQIRKNVERVQPEQRELDSRIPGAFTGWSGATLFRLENGQVWKQVERGKFSVRLDNPAVRIEKGLFGAYFLSVEGYGTRVKVKRLK